LLGGVAVVVLFAQPVEKLEAGFPAAPRSGQVLATQARQVAAVLTLAFRGRLRTLIDDDDDQVPALYPLPADSCARRLVYGNRAPWRSASTTGSSDRGRH
jgi:hypothetical protein